MPLISLFENSDKNSIYQVHILVGEDFKKENYQLLYSLEGNYFNCFIKIINVGNYFKNLYISFLDESAYYRLKLPTICPDNNGILKDLIDFYSLNFNGKYILGRLDIETNCLAHLNIYIKNCINSGVLLMDLYILRKFDM